MKHNCKLLISVLVPVVALAVALGGCIRSSYQAELLLKYQQLMTRASSDTPIEGRVIAQKTYLRSAAGGFWPVTQTTDEQTGQVQIELSLQEAVHRAMANSPEIMVSSFDPAISREEIIAREAAFDTIFNSTASMEKTDAQSNYGSVVGRSKTGTIETKLSKRFTSGAVAEVSYNLERSRTYNLNYFNDPNYSSKTSVTLTQPLLRGFGPAANTAEIRIARLQHEMSMQGFRGTVLEKLEEVQSRYWRLVQAYQDVEIQKRLLARSQKTLEHVKARAELDASRIQITDAQSTVESSKLLLLKAQQLVGDVQDELVRVIGDPSLQLMGDYSIVPTTALSDAPVIIDTAGQVASALKNNPVFAQRRRDIDAKEIQVKFQKNQALPRLDLTASIGYNGAVSDNAKDSYDQMAGGDYIDYTIKMEFEWPIGNRQKKSELRKEKLNRKKSIAEMQNIADQLAVGISSTVRQIQYSYQEIEVGRNHLKASLENLDAMEARRETIQAMTPSFLNQLLAAQEGVATAERTVLQSLVTYNTAQATLARLNGTAMKEMGVIVQNEDDVLELLGSYVELTGATEAQTDIPVEAEESSDQSDDGDQNSEETSETDQQQEAESDMI